jgi:transcriptional regulator with GAF, ATPase, and Fis domain
LSLTVWVGSGDPPAAQPQEQALGALHAAGVRTRAVTTTAAEGPGLVFFERFTPDLPTLVGRLSRGGRNHVMVVATRSAALADRRCWALLRAGADDVFAWDHSATPADEIAARLLRWERLDALLGSPAVRERLVGDNPRWRGLLRQIVEIARFTTASVLITGESGTGKELVARVVHDLDARPDKGELIVLDCGSVVPTLSGSEFFGHERGAFTGAIAAREGAFERADGGTLFLDEIGELPLPLQAELLRVIQEGTFKRVGSNTWRRTSFRLVCATNRDLAGDQAAGRFRPDLYHRIAGWCCRLPSLRERPDDILPLARHFLAELHDDGGVPDCDEPVRALLLGRAYPGNVRELRQLIARISFRHVGPGPITLGDVPADDRPGLEAADGAWPDDAFEHSIRTALARGFGMREIADAAAERAVAIAVADAGGSLTQASARLGVTSRALQLRRRRNGC